MYKIIIILFIAGLVCGCSNSREVGAIQPSASVLERADAEAAEVLRQFNTSDLVHKLGGPFELSEYSRTATASSQHNGVWVMYELSTPVVFDGHPQHFSILVYEDGRPPEVYGGR